MMPHPAEYEPVATSRCLGAAFDSIHRYSSSDTWSSAYSSLISRLWLALVKVYAKVAPQREPSSKGFSAESSTCVLFVSMPLTPTSSAPASPGGELPQGCERFCQKLPSGRRLPSRNAKPSLLMIRDTDALVSHSPTRLRMPMLNWSE